MNRRPMQTFLDSVTPTYDLMTPFLDHFRYETLYTLRLVVSSSAFCREPAFCESYVALKRSEIMLIWGPARIKHINPPKVYLMFSIHVYFNAKKCSSLACEEHENRVCMDLCKISWTVKATVGGGFSSNLAYCDNIVKFFTG